MGEFDWVTEQDEPEDDFDLDWVHEGEQPAPVGPPEPETDLIELYKQAEGDDKEALLGEFGRVPLFTRFSAKTKLTPEGVKSNLEHYYGEGRVEYVGDDNYAIRTSEGKPLLLEGAGGAIEEFGADIIDVLPEIAQTALSAAAGTAGFLVGGPKGAIAGGALGTYGGKKVLQHQDAVHPGESYPDKEGLERFIHQEGEALAEGLTDVATAGVARKVSPFLRALGRKIGSALPSIPGTVTKATREAVKDAPVEPGFKSAGDAAEAAMKKTIGETQMDIAEATLSPHAVTKRQALRARNPALFTRREIDRAKDVSKSINQVLDSFDKKKLAPENVGKAVMMVGKNAEAKIRKVHMPDIEATFNFARKSAADIDTGAMQNTMKRINSLLRQHGPNSELERVKDLIISRRFTVSDLQDQLSRFGKGFNLFSNQPRAENKKLTKAVFEALANDTDEIAKGITFSGVANDRLQLAGRMLKYGRQMYKEMFQEIDGAKSVFGEKLLKKIAPGVQLQDLKPSKITSGNKVIKELVGQNWDNKTVQLFLDTAEELNPRIGGWARRASLDRLLSKAKKPGSSLDAMATGGDAWDLSTIADIMANKETRSRIVSIVGKGNKEAVRALDALAELGKRAGAANALETGLGSPFALKKIAGAIVAGTIGTSAAGSPTGGAAAILAAGAAESALRAVFLRKGAAEAFLNPRTAGKFVDFVEAATFPFTPKRFGVKFAKEQQAHAGAAPHLEMLALAANRLLAALGEEHEAGPSEEEETARQAAEMSSVFTGPGKL